MRSSGTYDVTNPEFVSANRYGQMAPQQVEAFKVAYLWPGVGFLVLGAVISGFLLLMLGGMIVGMLADGDDEWWIGLIVLIFPVLFGGGFLVAGLRNLWTWSRVNATGALTMAEGRLIWQRNNYKGIIDGARLSLPGAAELPPGAYRFFYISGVNLIASVERLNLSASPNDTQAEITRALQESLDFTAEDLEANRTLQLSGRQRNGLFASVVGLIALLGILLLFPIVMAVGFIWSEGGFGAVNSSDVLPFLCFGGIMLGVVAVIAWSIVAGVREAFAGIVESVTGHLQERTEVRGSGKSRHTYYYYVIDGQKFQVTPAAHRASIEGMRYRLFYLPRSKKVMSAEPIPDPNVIG
jgi:hypothetical protein